MTQQTINPTVQTIPRMPVVRTPSPYMLNRIAMLQDIAGSLNCAVALPQGYRYGDINDAATELSSTMGDN